MTSPSPPPGLTRQALHALVWARPMTRVAAELGLSRVGLAKVCDRLEIPYPSRGHWSKAPQERAAVPPLAQAPAGAEEAVRLKAEGSGSRRRVTRRSPEVRREQLVAAAAEIIADEGLHVVSMRTVARAAAISEAQARNYFPNRAELLAALAQRELAAMQEQRDAAATVGRTRAERLALSTSTYLRQTAERGALVQVLLGSAEVRAALRPGRQAARREARTRMTQLMAARYGVPADLAKGSAVILTAVILRAGRLIGAGKLPLAAAERMALAILAEGNRTVVGVRARAAAE